MVSHLTELLKRSNSVQWTRNYTTWLHFLCSLLFYFELEFNNFWWKLPLNRVSVYRFSDTLQLCSTCECVRLCRKWFTCLVFCVILQIMCDSQWLLFAIYFKPYDCDVACLFANHNTRNHLETLTRHNCRTNI